MIQTVKKSFIFFVLCLLTFSCKSKKSAFDNKGTIRSLSEQKFRETVWTDQIEKDRLTKDITIINTIDSSVRLTPQAFISSEFSQGMEVIYPSIENFGSLNVSNLDNSIKKITMEFCKNISSYKNCDELLEKQDFYEYALFIRDLKENWSQYFFVNFPEPEYDEVEVKDSENQEKEKKLKKKLFDSFIIGEPFESNSFYEVPVRFFRKGTGSVDVLLFFYFNENQWKLNQFRLRNFYKETGHGKK